MARNRYDLVLRSAEMITPGVREFTFERADGEPLPFVPGQFLMIHFEHEGEELQRSYSIASHAHAPEQTSIAVAFVEDGRGTRYLWSLKPGDHVEASGPYGRFILRDEQPQRYVLVATGTGVAPYRTFLPDLARRIADEGARVDLMLGVRTPDELLYGGDFVAFAGENPGFTFTACYSRAAAPEDTPWARRCYVQHTFDDLALDPETDVVYLCGNPQMIDEAMEDLKARGFTPRQIRREKYISS